MRPRLYVSKLIFNDNSELELDSSDVVVFTGPNNVGKTQVLNDIYSLFLNDKSKGVVLRKLEKKKEGDIIVIKDELLQAPGFFNNNKVYYSNNDSLIEKLWEESNSNISIYFINKISTLNRLQLINNNDSFDALNGNPVTSIQKLYIDSEKETQISNLFNEAFQKKLIVNRFGGTKIPLHVANFVDNKINNAPFSNELLKNLKNTPLVNKQGDGIKSFAGMLIDIFTSQKSVTIIDEPEAFLHPPQARLLGKMFVNNKQNTGQMFISTHSENFLKGVLDANSDKVKIVRITRKDNKNNINFLKGDDISNLWKDSLLRYSNIFSGLFHSKVVICESDTDCKFYQAVLDSISGDSHFENNNILFSHCGGKERLKIVARALNALNLRPVIVSDLDLLNDKKTFQELCNEMKISWECIEFQWNSVFDYVRQQRHQLDVSETKSRIDKIFSSISVPSLSKENIDEIRKILKASSAWTKVKESGISFFRGNVLTNLENLLLTCKKNGLFIVPEGELESFYKPGANKHASAWLDIVLKLDLRSEKHLDAARSFVSEIANY